jgi:ribosomal protein S18 acetylase RimI-like enzyme
VKQTYFIVLNKQHGLMAIADVSRELSDFGDYEINRVSVPVSHRFQGYGHRLMQQIIDDADEEGAKLFLFAAPYGGQYGLDHLQLQRWYERFGFEVFPLRKGERAKLMVRKPRGR